MSSDLAALSPKWFNLNVAYELLPKLVEAAGVTIYVTVAAFALALVLGLPLLLLRRSGGWFIARSTGLFIEFVRSTPLLVQIYFFFFVLPSIGIVLPPITTGVVAIGIHYGCYMSEVYRSALESIARGQWDAAVALNFSRVDVYRRIFLPQMIPPMIPAAGNLLVYMLKDTPLLASISVSEMMFVAIQHGTDHFQYIEPITICGIIFLVLSVVFAAVIRGIEARAGHVWLGRRRHGA